MQCATCHDGNRIRSCINCWNRISIEIGSSSKQPTCSWLMHIRKRVHEIRIYFIIFFLHFHPRYAFTLNSLRIFTKCIQLKYTLVHGVWNKFNFTRALCRIHNPGGLSLFGLCSRNITIAQWCTHLMYLHKCCVAGWTSVCHHGRGQALPYNDGTAPVKLQV